ncbi:MAG: hypothetical protein MJE68_12030, partial [Proteobacteria bacterium]|nr:hypothetical protein [Pseudomonadota bacterium]
ATWRLLILQGGPHYSELDHKGVLNNTTLTLNRVLVAVYCSLQIIGPGVARGKTSGLLITLPHQNAIVMHVHF